MDKEQFRALRPRQKFDFLFESAQTTQNVLTQIANLLRNLDRRLSELESRLKD